MADCHCETSQRQSGLNGKSEKRMKTKSERDGRTVARSRRLHREKGMRRSSVLLAGTHVKQQNGHNCVWPTHTETPGKLHTRESWHHPKVNRCWTPLTGWNVFLSILIVIIIPGPFSTLFPGRRRLACAQNDAGHLYLHTYIDAIRLSGLQY